MLKPTQSRAERTQFMGHLQVNEWGEIYCRGEKSNRWAGVASYQCRRVMVVRGDSYQPQLWLDPLPLPDCVTKYWRSHPLFMHSFTSSPAVPNSNQYWILILPNSCISHVSIFFSLSCASFCLFLCFRTFTPSMAEHGSYCQWLNIHVDGGQSETAAADCGIILETTVR